MEKKSQLYNKLYTELNKTNKLSPASQAQNENKIQNPWSFSHMEACSTSSSYRNIISGKSLRCDKQLLHVSYVIPPKQTSCHDSLSTGQLTCKKVREREKTE